MDWPGCTRSRPAHVGADQVPGLVVLVGRGGQVHAEALGSLTIGGPAVQRDSLFRIASMTKPVTGVATLALAAEGLFRLDEPVDRLLPELANRRVLRQMDGPLERHRAGLTARSSSATCSTTRSGSVTSGRCSARPSRGR